MTRRNRWLKKQARKIARLKKQRKEYALKIAKYINEEHQNKILFPGLLNDLRKYAAGKQNIEAYKKALKNKTYESSSKNNPRQEKAPEHWQVSGEDQDTIH